MIKFIVQSLPSCTTQTHFFVSVKHFTFLKNYRKYNIAVSNFFMKLSNDCQKIRHTHTVLTDSCLNRYSGSTWSKFIEYPAVLPVLCVIVITNIELVCDFKSQDTRMKPKLWGYVNCSKNQFLLVYNYFIAQGHRHRGGRFLFLVVVVFLMEVSQKAGLQMIILIWHIE